MSSEKSNLTVRSEMGNWSLPLESSSVGGRELVPKPAGMACFLLVYGGHFILKFLGTMDGQNEVSVILGRKKAYRYIIRPLTYPILTLSLAG